MFNHYPVAAVTGGANALPHRPALPDAVRRDRVVVIIRGDYRAVDMPALADVLRTSGLTAVEVTANSPHAAECIAALAREERLQVGAGTVLDLATSRRLRDAGAQFLVTPNVDVRFLEVAAREGVAVMPGAFTPTEIITAWQAGAAAVKLFPANVLGPAFVSAMQGPVPHIPLIPTGGVSDANAAAFLRAGATALATATWLIPRHRDHLDLDQIRARARSLRHAIDNVEASATATPWSPRAATGSASSTPPPDS